MDKIKEFITDCGKVESIEKCIRQVCNKIYKDEFKAVYKTKNGVEITFYYGRIGEYPGNAPLIKIGDCRIKI